MHLKHLGTQWFKDLDGKGRLGLCLTVTQSGTNIALNLSPSFPIVVFFVSFSPLAELSSGSPKFLILQSWQQDPPMNYEGVHFLHQAHFIFPSKTSHPSEELWCQLLHVFCFPLYIIKPFLGGTYCLDGFYTLCRSHVQGPLLSFPATAFCSS